MTKASISLQDLRRRLYVKAEAETAWRFWGLYVHVCKMETLRHAYALAKENNGAPGVDRATFEVIETQGVAAFLEQIRDELVQRTYKPLPARGAKFQRTTRSASLRANHFLLRARLLRDQVPSFDECPFSLPAFRGLDTIEPPNAPQPGFNQSSGLGASRPFGYDSKRLAAGDSPLGAIIGLAAIFAVLFLGIYFFR